MRPQRGGFVLGLVVGLLVGLAIALGVALYITKTPVPFINKVPPHSPERDNAEAERNRNWDPNAALTNKITAGVAVAASAASAASASMAQPVLPPPPSGVQPVIPGPPAVGAAGVASAPLANPFQYFVQAGAYTRSEDAEQQRAKLGLLGQAAKVNVREQAGRTVYRVRIGPFENLQDADALQSQLLGQKVDARIVRVERE
jgi:cell division protein FtsN